MAIETRYVEKQWNTPESSYLHDTKSKRDYSLILGGMAWPSVLHGAAVVLGQARHKNPQTHQRDIWILDEIQGEHSTLFEFISDCEWRWKCGKFYGDGFHEPNMQFMHVWNRGHHGKNISLIDAPFVEEPDSFQVYFRLIKESLLSECKVLQLFGSTYPQQLQAVSGEAKEIKSGEHPGIVALGYALAAIRVYGHDKVRFPVAAKGYEPLEERLGI